MLIAISVFPVLVILVYIYYRDKYEKEPLGLLMKAFFGGVLSAVATMLLFVPLHNIFPEFYNVTLNAFFRSFAGAAIPEEFFKFVFLYWIVWNNKNFNENFDGIVYAVFIALGFACLENILYVYQYGAGVGVMRAFSAVPGHALDGVIMGFYFSLARFIPQKRTMYLFKCLFYAIVAHGIYDFLLIYASGVSEQQPMLSTIALLLFMVFIFYLWKLGFRKIKSHVDSSVFRV